MDIKIDLILLTSRTRKLDGRHPVVIRLQEARERKYRRVGQNYHKDEWDFNRGYPKNASIDEERALDKAVKDIKDEISQLKADGEDLSLDTIMGKSKEKSQPGKVLGFFKDTIAKERLISIGNANVYRLVYKSFKTFLNYIQKKSKLTEKELEKYYNPKCSFTDEDLKGTKDIKFTELTKQLLDKYNAWLTNRGANPRTKSMYFRTLKALFNRAIYNPDIKLNADTLPFGPSQDKTRFAISQFTKKTKKRALKAMDVAKISALDLTEEPILQEARDYFLFGVFGLGIDFTDIARLTWGNYNTKKGRIEYVRYKTRKQTDEPIDFEVDEFIEPIINKYRPTNKVPRKKDYIFNRILNLDTDNTFNAALHITEAQKHDRIRKVITRVNLNLKTIGQLAGIDESISTKWTRHTFASVLYRETEASLTMTKELLRHRDESTTAIYTSELESETKDKAARKVRELINNITT